MFGVFFVMLSQFQDEIGRGTGLYVALDVWQRWVVVL